MTRAMCYAVLAIGVLGSFCDALGGVATFEDLVPPSGGFWNGSDGSGLFASGEAVFDNAYNAEYGSWSGFAYSKMTDTTTAGYENQFSAFTGGGVNGSPNYAVGYTGMGGCEVTFKTPQTVSGFYVTNTTYVALSLLNGDAFSKKFGGADGTDEDWLKLTITGKGASGEVTGSVDFYLADYRAEDAEDDYALDTWKWVDLGELGEVSSLEFGLDSTDVGDWGMNTPAYFAMDDLNGPGALNASAPLTTFEGIGLAADSYWNGSDGSGGFTIGPGTFANSYNPAYNSWSGWAFSNQVDTTTSGYGNQFSAFSGGGVKGSSSYAVGYAGMGDCRIRFAEAQPVTGFSVTNTTYAALAMLNGDAFTEKFGGADGSDKDWFKLTITGKDASDEATGTVDVYLADYRFEDSSHDYVLDSWRWVDLRGLGNVVSLDFGLSSSDVGEWGMNTPAYFALDNLNDVPPTTVATVSTFEDVGLQAGTCWNGSDLSTGFQSGSVFFENNFNPAWGSWTGFAASTMTDVATPGYGNQYSAFAGSGAHYSPAYGVAYASTPVSAWLAPAEGQQIAGLYVTNTTFTALSIINGDDLSKKFGGTSGDDPDWFELTISGFDAAGETTGSVDFYLADYRFADNSQDYVVDQWTWVDLSGLGTVSRLQFGLSSSDVGSWGMNTPAYFALDAVGAARPADQVAGAPVPVSPVMAVAGTRPRFSWNSVAGATWYHLHIKKADVEGWVWEPWVEDATTWDPTMDTEPYDFPAGSYTWRVQGWSASSPDGAWSASATFTVGTPKPLAPAATAGGTQSPTFEWVGLQGATHYELSIRQALEGGWTWEFWVENVTQWDPVHNGSTYAFPVGSYQWQVRAWSESASYSDWSDAVTFQVGKPTPISPTGALTVNTQPEFSWHAVQGAEWYQLFIRKAGDAGWDWPVWVKGATAWVPEHNDATYTFAPGSYEWWVRAWSEEDSYGAWSDGQAFQVSVAPPGGAQLGSPKGAVSSQMPLFSWGSVAGAAWYKLFVRKTGTAGWDRPVWVEGKTSWSPVHNEAPYMLPAGEYHWWVQTWNEVGYGEWSQAGAFTIPE